MSSAAPQVARTAEWWELVRALWPVFTVIAGLAIAGLVLALKNMFVTQDAHKKHDGRIVVVEQFVIEQKTALGILPSRQDLATQIARQGERLTETREQIGEQLGEVSERVAGLEQTSKGIQDQLRTTNTYLHTIIERGLKS